jgi:Tol biopolymer transport system component
MPTELVPGIVSTSAREYGITFAPDMTEAYFTRRSRRGPPQIYNTRFEDGAWTEPALAAFSGGSDEAPFLTGDGSRVLFSSRRALPRNGDRSNNIWSTVRRGDGWSEPVPLEGGVNQPRREVGEYTTGNERGPVLLPSGALLYWTGQDPEWGDDLYVAEQNDEGVFADPRPLRLNSYGDESSPTMSPDGRYLVFQGYRGAEGFGGQDLYVSERTEHGWSDPRPLPEPINGEANDGYPSFSGDGRYFFFASDRGARGGYYSIYHVSVEALGLNVERR